jgi:hypothetical protein
MDLKRYIVSINRIGRKVYDSRWVADGTCPIAPVRLNSHPQKNQMAILPRLMMENSWRRRSGTADKDPMPKFAGVAVPATVIRSVLIAVMETLPFAGSTAAAPPDSRAARWARQDWDLWRGEGHG